jgi:hypothetical protein
MPEATRRFLAAFAQRGGTLLAVRRKPEGDWPSLELVAEGDLARRLAGAAPPDVTLEPAVAEIGFVHRRLPDADVYFLANTGNVARSVRARFRSATPHAELWDALSGGAEALASQDGSLALDLEAYASRVVVFRKQPGSPPPAQLRSAQKSEELRSGWSVSYGGRDGGTLELPHSWADDATARHFSGTATYRRSLQLDPAFRAPGVRVFLDFGKAPPAERELLPGGTMRGNSFGVLIAPPVREAATVFVNGKRAGSAWSPPFRVEITEPLKDGANEIRIDVYNTAINRLAEGGHLPDMAAITERYGQRTRLQDLDGLRPLPSGILSVPRLVAER